MHKLDAGHLETWLEGALQNGEEVNKAARAETMPPSLQEEEDCVVVKSVVRSTSFIFTLL